MQLNEFLFYYLLLYYILFASFIQLCATFFVSFYPEREIKPTERKKQQQHQQILWHICNIYDNISNKLKQKKKHKKPEAKLCDFKTKISICIS